MTKPMIRIHDTATGEIVDREMTKEEAAQHEKDIALIEAQKAAQETLEAKKQEVLAKLGLTADEVVALLA